jgi:hypothetical protein
VIIKIYRKRGKKKTKRVVEEIRKGLTLARIVFPHNQNFREACLKRERNGTNKIKTR